MNTITKASVFFSLFLSSNLYSITLDGQLNDPEWAEATVFSDFTVVDPYSLTTPEYRTEARIYTNESGIYIGVINFQPASTQKSELSARDSNIETDSNSIIIDFDNTAIAAYHFEVGNGGSMRDGIWSDENSFSTEWNGVWSALTSSDDEHWFTEIFIPWDVAPMIAVEGSQRTIGIHIGRFVEDLSKRYAISPISDNRQRYLSEFASIAINDYATSSLQVFAYTTARQNFVAHESSYDAGVDIFWKPSSSKQLSLSINPDFGQIESDNLVVNFSPTETFFSENRPFFTENQAMFDVSGPNNLRIIHTRRIGSRPDVGTEEGADIVAALKFTSVGENFNFGVFSAIENSDAQADGRNYYAGRITRKTDDYSVGYLLTYTDRPDIDRDAIVQAIDYSYNFTKDLRLNGQFINTNVNTPVDDSTDNATWFSIEHQITDTWDQSVQLTYFGDEFEINDLGFLNRNDSKSFNYSSGWQNYSFAQDSIVQDHTYGINLSRQENTQGDHLNSSIGINDGWSFKNTSNGFANLSYSTGGINDLITRGNGIVKTDSGLNLNIIYFADRRKKFQWHLRGNFFDSTTSGNGFFTHFHPSYQFNDHFQLRVGVTYTKSDDWLIWQGGTQLNSYNQERLLTEINFDATFSDKQEFSLKFEWIALQAEGSTTYMVDNNGNLIDLNTSVDNFNISDVAMQLRYRYEIAPLSNIYVVYSRGGRATIGDESSFSDLFSPGWDARDGDNFIVKIRYQF